MIKILAAVAGAAFLAGAAVLLSGMTPLVPTNSTEIITQDFAQIAVKGDRLDLRSYGPGCSERGWPYYETSCIRGASATREARPVRVVKIDRLPYDVSLATSR